MMTPTKILVVDDEPDLVSLIRQKFRKQIKEGVYAFSMAGNGVEALEKLDKEPDIEVVLTDINMPRMDGLTLLSHIGELNRMLQAIVISAYGDLDNIRMAMNRGSFDFLMKPIDLMDLEITVAKACETVRQQKRAKKVRETFGRYLSDEVVSTLLSNPEALKLGGEKRLVTMLMSDLRGFSNISEQLAPEKVVDILNIYLGHMADIITEYGGTIDEFIGDAILVIFGAPLQREDDAQRAVACALEMQNAMKEVNEAIINQGLPPLEMGIGINTGEVVVGNIGSLKRAKYGVVGSHVNLTSRIETYTVGGQILISQHTWDCVSDVVGIGKQMKVSTKGFSQPISIYEVEKIEGTYNILLPKQEHILVELDESLPMTFSILDGKHMTGEILSGQIIRLSSAAAIIKTSHQIPVLTNLRMDFPVPGKEGDIAGDLYAKVVGIPVGEEEMEVRFTAVPEEVGDVIRYLASNQ